MAKVIIVEEAPEKLKEGEAVIVMPTFLEQVKESSRQLGATKLTTVNNLRSVISAVGLKYDPDFSPLLDVNLSRFRDREYSSLEDFAKIVVEVFDRCYPKMFDKYLEYNIRQRQANVNTIYFVGPESKLPVFVEHGFTIGQSKKTQTKEPEVTE